MYQLKNDPISGIHCGIKRLIDNATIPLDPDNTDYQQYLEWVAEGNTPDPAE